MPAAAPSVAPAFVFFRRTRALPERDIGGFVRPCFSRSWRACLVPFLRLHPAQAGLRLLR